MKFSTFEKRIGYRFSAPDLLEEALRHGSAPGLVEGKRSYERLEFLGDAVLNLCVAQEMYRMLPLAGEGVLTKARASIINNRNLVKVADWIGVPESLRIASSVRRKGVGVTRKMAADAVEAVIGAIFLDGGHDAALTFVRSHFRLLDMMGVLVAGFDAKSRLQEWCQGAHLPLPEYAHLSADGPPHNRLFRVEVRVEGQPSAGGSGTSRKEAEMDAASKAISFLLAAGGETP
ncbi:MAG TPA: ribonuclease III [Candidatus Deferrimicrobium sp.]|nr:ribonuclease III [Candidatus Deferrimicrobium sp.]